MSQVIQKPGYTDGSPRRCAASLTTPPRWLYMLLRRPRYLAAVTQFETLASEHWSSISPSARQTSSRVLNLRALLDWNRNVSPVEDCCRQRPEQHSLQNRDDCGKPVDRPVGAEVEMQEVHQDGQPR